jgi:hypothetical protein
MMLALEGEQLLAVKKALSKTSPLEANSSIFGVLMVLLP